MIIKIKTLKELPYSMFTGYLLKSEDATKFVGDTKAYMFIAESPKAIYLFVEGIDELSDKMTKDG